MWAARCWGWCSTGSGPAPMGTILLQLLLQPGERRTLRSGPLAAVLHRLNDGESEQSECRRPERFGQWCVLLEADGRHLGRYRLILQHQTSCQGFAG